ncbi:pentachlorophenol monooxygenase [Streptomyces avermitilis]|uniref:Pentachlorophenol 4-monooxygenase n=2 Tax=Streptomyces avermitilis TaxID=33903 RepID=Q82PJ0_STRAW|nr:MULTISPECIES: FAD-dependent monooxygenase [Streptomyces]KUN51160.1 pentachlorophenol monooxygenase [Streptomyces avermitilis]MYS96553.1 pentachlorophenol monooxygenase [Streptomyces sp. SID5469]OOV21075.1 pentachlorophenol monooxygenase [Streptomyces avermitilis]BAC68622.1 putative pentachlorophenol 4-monooxygenase [Streptomyces avermitilis MA-4680 = NBRC 14893]BBJ48500.1 pentachlorophenol monooxygenase [Streptomyces avermitilis]
MDTTPLPARTEVAIVGAGPAGLALAVTLAASGIDFVVLDRLAEGANTSRAAVVHARTLEVLDELGASEELIARGIQVTRFAVRDGSRRLLTVPFDKLPTAHPYTLMVPQYETESVLLARLRALGGDVHRPHEVTSVVQDEDGVTLTMSTGQTLRAGYAVGTDGMHSTVREASGIGFTGSAYSESFVLADVVMDWAPGPSEVSLTFGTAGLTVVAPLPGGHYRVVATVDDAPDTPDLAFVQQLLDERAPGQAKVTGLAWSSRFRVHHRVADHYRVGRVLLAGDAAHVHSPAGGQGMNTGIQDGHALGRAFATGQLDGYEARRRPVAQRVVAFTDRMTRIATTHSAIARGARNIVLPLLGHTGLPKKLATELAELNYR